MTLTKLSVPQGGGQQALGPYGATEDYVKQQINLLIDQINVGGGLDVSSVTVSVSSAELLALQSVPKELIAAPGAGKVINVIEAFYSYTFVTSGYTFGDDPPQVVYNSPDFDSVVSAAAGLISGSSSAVSTGVAGISGISVAPVINKSIILHIGDTISGGGGSLKITLFYSTITL